MESTRLLAPACNRLSVAPRGNQISVQRRAAADLLLQFDRSKPSQDKIEGLPSLAAQCCKDFFGMVGQCAVHFPLIPGSQTIEASRRRVRPVSGTTSKEGAQAVGADRPKQVPPQ